MYTYYAKLNYCFNILYNTIPFLGIAFPIITLYIYINIICFGYWVCALNIFVTILSKMLTEGCFIGAKTKALLKR